MTYQLANVPPLVGASERLREDVCSHLVRVAVAQNHRAGNNLLMEPCQIDSVGPGHVTNVVASAGLHYPDGCLIVFLEIKMGLAAQYFVPKLQGRKTFGSDG